MVSRKYRTKLAILFLPILHLSGEQTNSLIPLDPISSFSLSGLSPEQLSVVKITDQEFSRAWRVRTPSTAAHPWDIRLIGQPIAGVVKGDTIVAAFWMRTVTSEQMLPGYTRFVVEQKADPYLKSVEWAVSVGREWKKFEIPFIVAESSSSNGYTVQFWLSYGPQEVDIGGLSVTNMGPAVEFKLLELQNYPYEGHSPTAQWRDAAAKRIDKMRKSDIIVVVNNDQGQAIPNAKVRVQMKRHAFSFGSAVDAETLLRQDKDGDNYRTMVRALFNKAVLENDLKWPQYEQNRGRATAALDWLRSQGITQIRGHTLVWPDWQYLPADAQSMRPYPEALRGRVRSHITDEAGNMKGKVTEWDVLNEAVVNRSLQEVLGDSEMAEWFRLTRAADPGVKLYINDYSILEAGGNDIPQQRAYEDLIRKLQSMGAPLDGIGLQAHFDQNFTPPDRLIEIFNRFAALGKPLQVTELDTDTPDESAQASYTRDFLTAAFSHPAVNSVMLWGFWEGRHWRPKAAMVRNDWTLKPSGEAWKDLVFRQWWTDVSGKTSEDGTFRVRAFLGDYEIEIDSGGRKTVIPAKVTAGPGNFIISGRLVAGAIEAGAVVNAASYARGAVAPGEIVTMFGTGFGPDTLMQAAFTPEEGLATTVGDTSVWFDGTAAPLIYVAPGQVSCLAPYSISGSTTIQVQFRGAKTNPVRLPVAEASPGIFTMQGGTGQAVAIYLDALNSATNPAPRGAILTFYINGAGRVNVPVEDGKPITTPEYPIPVQPLAVLFGNEEGRVEFRGLVYPGVNQVNVRVPMNAPTGNAVPLLVKVGTATSQPGVTVAIGE
jgi:endo-1,4-beta-xylanase